MYNLARTINRAQKLFGTAHNFSQLNFNHRNIITIGIPYL
jgi:hypothetical protein